MSEEYSAPTQMIKTGSLSFSLASQLFGHTMKRGSHLLYAWCRYCDDQLDRVDLDQTLSSEEKSKMKFTRLEELRELTESVYRGEPQRLPVFQAFQEVVTRFRIPKEYPLDLLEGMAMDARMDSYETLEDLELYCYRVAGVVGLMMCHVMGIKDEIALEHAVSMGNAMQMTNIARDIIEDAEMGRVYLPSRWLAEEGVSGPESILNPANRGQVSKVTKRLLKEADRHYRIGAQGLKYLPNRAAFTIRAASSIYRSIGTLVLSRGAQAWDQRAVVSLGRKIICILGASLRTLFTLRWPKACVSIEQVWRPTG